MKFKIDAVQVLLQTSCGLIDKKFEFKSGLNVIRGNNSSGKSSLLSAIYYALGFEIILGKKGVEALRSVFFKSGKSEKKMCDFEILESCVLLQITNSINKTITLRRYIKSEKRNSKLIEISECCIDHLAKRKNKWSAYFLHDPGAASRSNGFHTFLADFLQLHLPEVQNMDGKKHPLYMECLLPLMAIEQKNGWSSIQRTTPSYGIKGIKEISFEYLLDLDVFDSQQKKFELQQKDNYIKQHFVLLKSEFENLAISVGGDVRNFPETISSISSNTVYLEINDNDQTFDQDSFKLHLQKSLDDNRTKQKETFYGTDDQQQELFLVGQKIPIWEMRLADVKQQLAIEKDEDEKLSKHKESISHDIITTKDLIKLRNFGAESIATAKNICPICLQSIPESLDVTDRDIMSLEENVAFLEAERDALNALWEGKKKSISKIAALAEQIASELSSLRCKSRDLSYDLSHGGSVSKTLLREELQLSEKIDLLTKTITKLDDLNVHLQSLSLDYKNYLNDKQKIPKEYFSKLDLDKIGYFSDCFSSLLKLFHCTNQPDEIQISRENYKPVENGLDLIFDSSASDGVRLIWSYSIALMQVAQKYQSNHWGIVIFDEPGQHQMAEKDFVACMRELLSFSDFQVIVATSMESEKIHSWQSEMKFNLIESGKFIFDFD